MANSALSVPTFKALSGNIFNANGSTPIYSAGAWSFLNSSGTTTFTVSDAGAVTVGVAGANPGGSQYHVFNGNIVSGGTGTSDFNRRLYISSNSYVAGLSLPSKTAAGLGGCAINMMPRTSDTESAFEILTNSQADGATTAATIKLGITQAGAVTLGPASGLTAKHIIRASGPTNNVVLEVKNSSADQCFIDIAGSTNNIGIGSSAGQAYISGITSKTASGGATVYVTGTSLLGTSTSVREAKTNIQPLDSTLGWLKQLKPYVYQYRKQVDGKYTDEAEDFVNTGLIYDEVVQVNPQLCFDTAEGKPSGVEYTRLITPLLKAFQEQQALIEALQAKVAALEAK